MTADSETETSRKPARRGGELRAEFSDLVRTRIRQAASELFAEKGYKGTTVRQIARRAGSTHTTFYNYYKSKEAVLYSILGGIGPQVSHYFMRVPSIVRDENGFRAWFAEYNDFWLANRGIYLAFWEAMYSDPKVAATTRRLMDGIAQTLAVEMAEPGTAVKGAIAARLALWLHNIDSILMLTHTSENDDEAAALDAAASILWSSLRDITRA